MSNSKLIIPELIVGLGNPESRYFQTRHNIGFDAVDSLALAWSLSWQDNRRFQGAIAERRTADGNKILLLKPLTYMNRSGQSVRAVIDWYKIAPGSILVIYDDMDLPVGRLRIRRSGSAGGHNGMKSIISHLGNQDFPRLRIGIGKSDGKKQTIGHVLGKFAPEEKKVMQEVLDMSVNAVDKILAEGVDKAMNNFNSKKLICD